MTKKVGIKVVLEGNLPEQFKKVAITGKKSMGIVTKSAKKATGAIKSMGSSLFSLKGLIAGAGIGLLTKKITDLTLAQAQLQDESIKMARSLGIAVEDLTALRRSAQLGGAETATLDAGMRRLSRNLFDASRGIGEAKIALDAMGIASTNTDGTLRNTVDVLNDVSDSFSEMEDGTLKSARAQLLFGKSGVQLINTLNVGSDALREQAEEAERLGVIFSGESAKGAEAFNDAVLDLGNSIDGAFRSTLEDILPKLTPLIKELTTDIAENKDDIKEFGESLFGLFKKSIPVIKSVAGLIAETVEGWDELLYRMSGGGNFEAIAELANEQYKVTKELKEQEAILEKFEKSGFVPPSVLANVNALDSKLFDIKGKLQELQGGGTKTAEESPEVITNQVVKAKITEDNDEHRGKEEDADIEWMRKNAEAQRAFELKKFGVRTEYAKKQKEINDEVAESELRGVMTNASAIISANRAIFGDNKISATNDILMRGAQGVQRAFSDLAPPYSYIQAGAVTAMTTANVAKVNGLSFADGGYIEGAGSGRSDSINANVSAGEAVIKADIVAQNGGREWVNATNAGASTGNTYNINVSGGMGSNNAELAQMVANEVRRIENDRIGSEVMV